MTQLLAQPVDRVAAIRSIAIIMVAVLALVIVMSFVFGVHLGVMDYRLAPDPAGNLPY